MTPSSLRDEALALCEAVSARCRHPNECQGYLCALARALRARLAAEGSEDTSAIITPGTVTITAQGVKASGFVFDRAKGPLYGAADRAVVVWARQQLAERLLWPAPAPDALANNGRWSPERLASASDADVLELTLQLHGRALAYGNREQHDAYVEARAEVLRRLAARARPERERLAPEKIAATWGQLEMEAHEAWVKIQEALEYERPMTEYGDYIRLYCAHRILARMEASR